MKIIEDTSGVFHVTDDGVLEKFVPHSQTKFEPHPVEKLVIPEGVIKIGTRALEDLHVTQELRFPRSLVSIGTEIWETGISWCNLPDVVIPDGVKEMTSFAFGKCHLRSLCLPSGITFIGGRHFKGSHIGTLYLPESCKDDPPGELFGRMSPLFALEVARGNNLSIDEIRWYSDK